MTGSSSLQAWNWWEMMRIHRYLIGGGENSFLLFLAINMFSQKNLFRMWTTQTFSSTCRQPVSAQGMAPA